jgi:hypothetical protein
VRLNNVAPAIDPPRPLVQGVAGVAICTGTKDTGLSQGAAKGVCNYRERWLRRRSGIPQGHAVTALKDELSSTRCRSTYGGSLRAGARERTWLATGSIVWRRAAKGSHQANGGRGAYLHPAQSSEALICDVRHDGVVADSDLSFALELADLAAEVSMKTFRCAELTVETKADGSPVTEVDRTVEGALRDAFATYHPSDRVVGEEFGGEPGRGRCWYLDPIEGTSLYIKGSLYWSTLISLAVDGVVTTGVVDYPAAGQRYWAFRGDGAFANGDPMQASTVSRLEDATVCDDYHHNIERATPGHPLVRLARYCSTVRPPPPRPLAAHGGMR